jgi:DNA gyrase subunit A
MSTIVARALPDVRDGLKSVHRRILYAMSELGLQPGRARVKCARVVGEVMGNYHRTAMLRSTTRSSGWRSRSRCGYPLVDGQGNFGNIDGYPAAAQRYTECRLAKMASELLRDIDSTPSTSRTELRRVSQGTAGASSRFPNLLVNGSTGIAVGMATNIPPHNLGEVTDALIALIDDPDRRRREALQAREGP